MNYCSSANQVTTTLVISIRRSTNLGVDLYADVKKKLGAPSIQQRNLNNYLKLTATWAGRVSVRLMWVSDQAEPPISTKTFPRKMNSPTTNFTARQHKMQENRQVTVPFQPLVPVRCIVPKHMAIRKLVMAEERRKESQSVNIISPSPVLGVSGRPPKRSFRTR